MPGAANAIVMKNALVTVDTVEFANQVRKARLVPTQNIQTYRTLVPDGAQQDVDSATWVLELAGLQINHTGGLADALRDGDGLELDVILQPKVGTGQPKMTFVILGMQVPFGGETGTYMEIDMSFPVIGAPTPGVAS